MTSDGPPPVGGLVASGRGASGRERPRRPPERRTVQRAADAVVACGCWSPTTATAFHGFAENRGVPRRPSPATCAGRSSGCCAHPVDAHLRRSHRRRRPRPGPGRHLRHRVRRVDPGACATPSTGSCGPEIVVREVSRGAAPTSTPGSRRRVADVPLHWCSTGTCRTRSWPPPAGGSPDPLDLRPPWPWPAIPLLGEHDFSSFCRRPKGQETGPLVRRVHRAEWHEVTDEPGLLRFEITAIGLLPPDGAQHRRPAGGRGEGAAAPGRRAGGGGGPGPLHQSASWRHPRG